MSRKLVLIDGHSLAYRAFHALPADLRAPDGELTNATFGFVSMLLTVLEQESPDYLVVTFDAGPSFRVERYAEYKAHREKMPGEMRSQMDRIRELVNAFGIPIVELEHYEADDLLGTLAHQAEARGLDVLIVTGDRDALQLVSDSVTVLTSGRRFSDTLHYTPALVQEKYGLRPPQLVDLKALIGDRSDNIPGVRGVGEKGATDLLQRYGTLEGLYAHLEDLPPRYRNALEGDRDSAFLSYDLGRIRTDAPVELDLQQARWGAAMDRERVLELCRELGFRSLVDRLGRLSGGAMAGSGSGPAAQLGLFEPETPAAPEATQAASAYRCVVDRPALEAMAERLASAERIALDTETTGTDPVQASLVGISFSSRAGEGFYLPVMAPSGEATVALSDLKRVLAPLLSDIGIEKLGHNLKYDLKILRRHGLEVKGPLFDTMVAEWVLNPDSANLGLKNQAWARLGLEMTEIEALIGKGSSQITMDQVELDKVTAYAAADADITFRLAELLRPELEAREQITLFRDLEMPLLPVLVDMELAGVKLDLEWLSALSRELAERLERLEAEIHHHAGTPFNINSTQQLSEVLFDRLGLSARGVRKTKSGHYSTRADVLEGLRGAHPVVDGVLAYRELAKLKSTYVDALPQLVNPETGRVHTSYNPTGAVTGRLSSTNPNLQNIPIRTEEGRRVRRAFVADAGCLLLSADYSQVELRVMAHISGDAGLRGAFERDEDIHATTAAAVYGVPLDSVTADQRRIAKAVNFGLIYGQSAYGLARQLGIPVDEAQLFIDRYFDRFPGVRRYMDEIQNRTAELGYVETLLKRRRYFPELSSDSAAPTTQRQNALRMAINTPIQGSAADILKLAMIRMHAELRERELGARMLLQVHDEVVLEVPEGELNEAAEVVRSEMQGAFPLDVPLKVDLEFGPNWEDMRSLRS